MMNESEIKLVDTIGKEIGFGHLMSLASALWRRDLKEKGYPTSGAFIPTILDFLPEEYKKMAKESAELYDSIIYSQLSFTR